MKSSNKKILVTGATGFVGANIARHFVSRGADVAIFTRHGSDKWRINDILKKISDYPVDLLDERSVQKTVAHIKPAIILHAATYGGYQHQKDTRKIFDVNFTGTVNLLKACKETGFELFVHTGSSSEYGLKTKPIKEDSSLKPVTDYGVSKAAASLYCQSCALRDRLPIAILRLFSPYGYFDDASRLIPYLIGECLADRGPRLSSPFAVRDFIFIDDVLNAYVKVIENKNISAGHIFNIGYGKQNPVGYVAGEVARLTGSPEASVRAGKINPRLEPAMWQADIDKARKMLGWRPKTGISKGLQKTIEWFKTNKKLYKNRMTQDVC